MKILLSNDDGYRAPGLRALVQTLGEVAELVVMAPSSDRSCSSSSLTLRQPIAVHRVPDSPHEFYHVEGTPADCVHLAINGFLGDKPDMVVSGVNAGSNLGDDVIYSGTVAAAIEGRFLGLPALAVSLASDSPIHYESAARVVRDMIAILVTNPLPGDIILNINVPDLPYEQLSGMYATRCGARHQSQPVIDDGGEGDIRYFRIGPSGSKADAGPGTDFHAIAGGRVSITPLHIDMTRHSHMTEVAQWVAGLQIK